jgi:hypothetical protein
MSGHHSALVRIWAILAVLTVASTFIAESVGIPVLVYGFAFAIAILKGQMVAVHFMETPLARPVWNALYRSWIVFIGLVLLAGNIISLPAAS